MTLYLGSNQVSGNGGGQAEIQDSGTVINNGEAGLDAIGVVTKSGQILYDWVGTKEEYEAGIADGSIDNEWVCWITDDEGLPVGGSEIVDSETIVNNESSGLDAVGVKTKDGSILYDWVGTKSQYDNGIADGSISDDWVCWITDDETSSTINKKDLFDVVYKDHVLSYEESFGYAQLGSYVYKEAVLNEHYGYPDFYNICVEEKNNGISTQTTLGSNTITLYINNNGRQYYDISNKDAVDAFYSSCGIAWFYGVDTENERIFLPRNDYYFKNGSTENVGKYIEEGLPSITHTHTGATSETGSHTHTRGTMNITGTFDPWVVNEDVGQTVSGAFTKSTTSVTGNLGWEGDGTSTPSKVTFTASNNWTGATSSNGAHKHTFTTSNNSSVNGIYGKSDTVQPKSVSMIAYMIVGNVLTEVGHTTIVEQMNGALLDIENAKQSSLEEITENKESSLTEITNLYNDSMSDIQSLKDTSESDITSLATSSKEELNTLRANSVTELSQLSDSSNQELNTLRDDSVSEITNLYNTSYNSIQELHDTSYDNLQSETEAGVNRIQQTSNALNQTQITNCLLEVPQNIKLELKDGVLTLKAGSKVIVPNGVGVFNEVVINSDINFTYTFVPPTETPCMLFINASGTSFVFSRSVETCFSGTTQPSGNYRNWYNTTENKMYSIGGNATVDGSGFSFPIAMITQDSDGVTKSIDQVFNGIGYIGSHLFINKDVKGLIPNGFNSDGTLKNIEFTVPNVIVSSRELTQKTIPVWYRDNNTITFSTGWSYIESTNKVTAIIDGVTTAPFCQIATVDMTSGVISNFQPKTPFRAVDYNEYKEKTNHLEQNSLNNKQITNCLLEVPENIKLELKDGKLILKAGSTVVVPNGFESNGTTLKFDYITITSDLTQSIAFSGSYDDVILCYNATNNSLGAFRRASTETGSGTGSITIGYYYNSANNKVIYYSSGTADDNNYSLPIGIFSNSTSSITKINTVLNGFSVIGHHTFTFAGVKSLLPNGRNADNTLNNREVISTSTIVTNETGKSSWICFFDGSRIITYGVTNYFEQEEKPTFNGQHCMWLNTKENVMYSTSDYGATWTKTGLRCYLGGLRKNNNGAITEFKPNEPVELVKKGDIERNLVEVKAYITETYVNGSSGYNIWSNKYCEQWGISEELTGSGGTVTISLLKSYKDTEYIILTESKGEYQATGQANDSIETVTTSSFTIHSGMTRDCRKMWKTMGFLA